MGNLIETASWDVGVPYFAADAVLTGGPDCPDNIPIQALANRTTFLKKQIDDAVSGALTMMYANKLKTARTIAMTGDGSWIVTFDGSGNVSAAMALANSGVVAGTYPVITVDAKGRATGGRALAAADIPALDWSKLTSGKPTTLAGYGIIDAAASTHTHTLSIGNGTATQISVGTAERLDIVAGTNVMIAYDDVSNKLTISTTGVLSGNADTATKLATARTIGMTGDIIWTSSAFDGSANVTGSATLAASGVVAGTYSVITVDAKGRATGGRALIAADIPALDWSKITSGKPTTLAGYGITDSAIVLSGTQAARPAAGTATRLYLATDTFALFRDNGTTWDLIEPAITGDISIPAGSTAATLANSGVVAGTYPVITVDAKGRATAGRALAATDIPALDWSKITSGKPTTLAGYGITDSAIVLSGTQAARPAAGTATRLYLATDTFALFRDNGTTWDLIEPAITGDVTIPAGSTAATLANSGVVAGTYPVITVDAKGRATGGRALAAADIPALDWSKITSGKPTTASGYGITLTTTDIPALDWNKIFSGKPTTLAGYGITDAQALNSLLTSISGLAANGLIARTAAGTAAARTITAGAGVTVTNGDGVAGNPTVALSISGVAAGTYPKVAVDAYGRVIGGAALAAADIPSLDWSKIGSGQPTTLAGYGITDAAPIVPVRQTVLSGVTDSNGRASFIAAGAGLTCNLSATAAALSLAFSSGFGAGGAIDYVERITADAAGYWSNLQANNLSYLTITRNGAGNLSAGSTLAPVQYGYAYDQTKQALLHFDGVAGSTSMLDDFGNAWTAQGGAKLQSTWSKFGGTALGGGGASNVLNGTTDYAMNSTITTLGSGGWAMRGYVRPTSLGAAISGVFAAANVGNYGCSITITSAGRVALYLSSTGTSWDITNATTGTATLAANNDYFIEVTFDPIAGKYFVYVNGVLDQTINSSLRVCAVVSMRVGSIPLGPYYLTGYIDEVEFVPYCDHPNGTAYSVPTAAKSIATLGYASDWFDLSSMTMKSPSAASAGAGNNPTFTTSAKLYVGEAITGAASVSSVASYALQGKYEGRGQAITISNTADSFAHNIGVQQLTVTALAECIIPTDAYAIGDTAVCTVGWSNGTYETGYAIPVQANAKRALWGATNSVSRTYIASQSAPGQMLIATGNFRRLVRIQRAW